MSGDLQYLDRLLSRLDIESKKAEILDSYNTIFEDDVLVSLDLIRTGITDLPEDLFADLRHLEKLFLSHNPIKMFPEKIFHPLWDLSHLDLRGTELQYLHEQQFSTLFKLKRLELNDNNLETIPAGIFDNLYSVVELNLSNNSLSYLDPDLFSNLVHLERFYLYFNPLPGDIANGDYYDRDSVEEVINRISDLFDD